jgi:hypothetical protein
MVLILNTDLSWGGLPVSWFSTAEWVGDSYRSLSVETMIDDMPSSCQVAPGRVKRGNTVFPE